PISKWSLEMPLKIGTGAKFVISQIGGLRSEAPTVVPKSCDTAWMLAELQPEQSDITSRRPPAAVNAAIAATSAGVYALFQFETTSTTRTPYGERSMF